MVTALSALQDAQGRTYEVVVGDEHLDAESAPPRIVLVPSKADPAATPQQMPKGLPRTLAGELNTFVAVFWARSADGDGTAGADYFAVSDMRAAFNSVMRGVFGSSFKLGAGEWSSQDGSSITELGRKFEQEFTLMTALLEDEGASATVTTTTTNAGLNDPGTDFTNP